jgi:hypothetical protein
MNIYYYICGFSMRTKILLYWQNPFVRHVLRFSAGAKSVKNHSGGGIWRGSFVKSV